MNQALAAAAATLIGVRFRLHGRDPATGLDCVGTVAEAMRRSGLSPVAPQGYRLRAATIHGLRHFADLNQYREVTPEENGDVVLAMVSPVQPHLMLRVPGGFVHAHAGLGRVTFLPGTAPWPLAGGWIVPPPKKRK